MTNHKTTNIFESPLLPPHSPQNSSRSMVQKLEVRVGAHRFAMDLADVNGAPTEIETDKFVGRVLVRVRDFTGAVFVLLSVILS